ncbi:MAG TPA: tripartite tricarboxylate transporter permease, partial [Bacillota bacterium]|nr:tripartite tricarboxylate transporter permease [Bacillota bacterium]
YGKGIPEGVIATETSNNATTGGTLVPLLTLGIPGDSVTAVIFGGLLIHGLTPGPDLFAENLDVVHGLFGTLIIANIFMLILGMFFIRYLVKIASVPKNVLIPIIVVFCFIGSFSISNNIFDVWVALAFGVLGYFMMKFNYPLPPLILGMILGPIIESNLRRSLIQTDEGIMIFLTRPISLIFLIVTILTLLYPVVKNLMQQRKNIKT